MVLQLGSIVVFALFLFPLLMSLLSSTLFSVTQYNDSAPPVHGEAAAKDNQGKRMGSIETDPVIGRLHAVVHGIAEL